MNEFYRFLRQLPLRRGPGRMVGGICGGIAAKFGWNVTVVRLVTLLLFLLPGIGLVAYAIVWLLLPKYDESIALQRLLGN